MSKLPTALIFLAIFSISSHASYFSIISPKTRTDEEVQGLYEQWLVKHGKVYNGLGEKDKRLEIFKDNLKFIDEHNSENRTYQVGLNQFADITNDEYRSMYLGTRSDAKRRFVKAKNASQRYVLQAGDRLPEFVDWRERGAVAPVKNQGTCGKF